MEQWVKKLGSLVAVSLLAIALNGKASADDKDTEMNTVPPTNIIEPAEATEESGVEESENNNTDTDAPNAADEVGEESAEETSDNDDDAIEETGVQDDGIDEDKPADFVEGDSAGEDEEAEESEAEEQFSDESGAAGSDSDEDAAEKASGGDDLSGADVFSISPQSVDLVFPLADTAAITPSDDDDDGDPADNGSDNGAGNEDPAAAESLRMIDDDLYVMVNHDGTESLSSETDITVLAAGLNHIGAISAGGFVKIAGTGIMLVDSIQGQLDLLTLTDIYEEGSAAVFLKAEDGSYRMINGSIPGILDETYQIEGCTLVVPENSRLLLCGTGAIPGEDGTVDYYHGTEHGRSVRDADIDDVVEMTGNLSIGQDAKLIIDQGGSVEIHNLKSVGYTDNVSHHKLPVLSAEAGGEVTVNGTVDGGGLINIAQGGRLDGSGIVYADQIIVSDPASISAVSVEFNSNEMRLNGSGELRNLKVNDSRLFVDSSEVMLTGFRCKGNTLVLLAGTASLNLASVEGMLELTQYKDDTSTADEEYNIHQISGAVSGSGTIAFSCGTYVITAGTTMPHIQIDSTMGGRIYDYACLFDASLSPFHIQPNSLPEPTVSAQGRTITVSLSLITEGHERMGIKKIFIDQTLDPKSILAAKDNNGSYFLNLDNLKALSNDVTLDEIHSYCTVVELVRKDASGVLHTDYLNGKTMSGTVNADNLYLIRMVFAGAYSYSEPAGSATQTSTSYTGSGILGGSGAGSVNIGGGNGSGSGNNDNGNGSGSGNTNNDSGNGTGIGNNDNGNGAGDNGNGNGTGDNGNGTGNDNANNSGNGSGTANDNGNGSDSGNGNDSASNADSSAENSSGNNNGNGSDAADNSGGNNSGTVVDNGSGSKTESNGNNSKDNIPENNTGKQNDPVNGKEESSGKDTEAKAENNSVPDNTPAQENGSEAESGGKSESAVENKNDPTADNTGKMPGDDREDAGEQDEEDSDEQDLTMPFSVWVEATGNDGFFLRAAEGGKTLRELGGQTYVSMAWELKKENENKPVYAVFRSADGKLTAFRADYNPAKKQLGFISDRLGRFVIVSFAFDGEEFSDEFYAELAKLPVFTQLG